MRVLIPALLLLVSTAMAGGLDQEQARELVDRGEILPLTDILEKARGHYSGRLLEVELEYEADRGGYLYELEILDEQGVVWELEFDAATGKLVKRERD